MKPCVFLVLGSFTVLLSACSNLKPVTASPRYFLLAPSSTPAPEKPPATNSTPAPVESSPVPAPALAVATIKFPDYLAKKSLAIRKSAIEIAYLESAHWAERLDEGFLRVLTADLAARLPGRAIHTRSGKDDLGIQLTVQQFDVNGPGQAVLTAEWRIVSPPKGKSINAGRAHLSRNGPNPERDPGGAVSTLSMLINDLSAEIGKTIR